jgi:hypothetical protein
MAASCHGAHRWHKNRTTTCINPVKPSACYPYHQAALCSWSAFMCFTRIAERTAIISLFRNKWLGFLPVFRFHPGTNMLDSHLFVTDTISPLLLKATLNKMILIDKIYCEHAKTVMFFLCTLQGLLGPSPYHDGRCTYHNWQLISALVREERGESYHPCHFDWQSFCNVRWLKDIGAVTVYKLVNVCSFSSCFCS